jgi:hypothetical protein
LRASRPEPKLTMSVRRSGPQRDVERKQDFVKAGHGETSHVIASEAKQSRTKQQELDCFVASRTALRVAFQLLAMTSWE